MNNLYILVKDYNLDPVDIRDFIACMEYRKEPDMQFRTFIRRIMFDTAYTGDSLDYFDINKVLKFLLNSYKTSGRFK